jgi:hypothetical protein
MGGVEGSRVGRAPFRPTLKDQLRLLPEERCDMTEASLTYRGGLCDHGTACSSSSSQSRFMLLILEIGLLVGANAAAGMVL